MVVSALLFAVLEQLVVLDEGVLNPYGLCLGLDRLFLLGELEDLKIALQLLELGAHTCIFLLIERLNHLCSAELVAQVRVLVVSGIQTLFQGFDLRLEDLELLVRQASPRRQCWHSWSIC